MPDKVSVLAWTLLGMGSFTFLGSVFGGLAGGLSWRQGRAAGSNWATHIARHLSRLCSRELSTIEMGVLIGGVDGGLFLGLLGTLLGIVAGYQEAAPGNWILTALGITAPLLLGAGLFGLLAQGLIGRALGALLLALVGATLGATVAILWRGVDHVVPGIALGLFAGTGLALLFYRRE